MSAAAPPLAGNGSLVSIRDLEVGYSSADSFLGNLLGRDSRRVRAVDGVSLELGRGEVLGLVGESGSGKTTLGRALLGLVKPSAGSVEFDGTELTGLGSTAMRPLRRRMQMVFQDPHAALNPAMDLETSVGHPLIVHGLASRAGARRHVIEAFERVGLTPPDRFLGSYPDELSGGQKQRAVIARAIIAGPELIVADEPVSMLDMSVRAKVLELLLELKRDLGLTFLYITHDLATARLFCDRIAILYLGRVVELRRTEELFAEPLHPYTRALLAAIPDPAAVGEAPREVARGEIPDAAEPPRGCHFHPRCPLAFERCGWERRDLRDLLERYWSTLPVESFERERALVRTVEPAVGAVGGARLEPGAGTDAEQLREYLAAVREATAADPLWSAVRSVEVEAGAVVVEFAAGEEPRLRPGGGGVVACHLIDDEN